MGLRWEGSVKGTSSNSTSSFTRPVAIAVDRHYNFTISAPHLTTVFTMKIKLLMALLNTTNQIKSAVMLHLQSSRLFPLAIFLILLAARDLHWTTFNNGRGGSVVEPDAAFTPAIAICFLVQDPHEYTVTHSHCPDETNPCNYVALPKIREYLSGWTFPVISFLFNFHFDRYWPISKYYIIWKLHPLLNLHKRYLNLTRLRI